MGRIPLTSLALGILLVGTLPARADFLFAHVTDLHVTASRDGAGNAAKDAARLKEMTGASKPAFIVATGDIVEAGTPDEYETFRAIVAAAAPAPFYLAPGNHDVRWNPLGKDGFKQGVGQELYRSFDFDGVHFILLDSTILLQHWGHFDAAQLAWLKKDLAKTGTKKPIVIGFHHPVGRDGGQIDNEPALLELLQPYNVRLFLMGHGHADLAWNVAGIPAVMAKGLYQGSYHLVKVTKDSLDVLRKTDGNASLERVVSIPRNRPAAPRFIAGVKVLGGKGRVTVNRGELPAGSTLSMTIDERAPVALSADGPGWFGNFEAKDFEPGSHRVTVVAALPDGRRYPVFLTLNLAGPQAVAPVWTAPVSGEIQGKLTREGERVYVASMGGTLTAHDGKTGALAWTFAAPGALFGPAHVDSERVYAGCANNRVYALDKTTGKILWSTPTGGAVFAGPNAAKGIVCAASTDKMIYGLDEKTGAVRWKVSGDGLFQSAIGSDGERFFVGGWDDQFRCLDAATGRELWSRKFGRSFYYAPAIGAPAVENGVAYVTSNDGILHAVDVATGNIVWETPALSLGYSGPIVSDDKIYVGSLTDDGRVYCFDAKTGAPIWMQKTGSVLYDSSCALSKGILYIAAVNGRVSAIQTKQSVRFSPGTLLWRYRLPAGHVFSTPVADADRLVIGSMNGTAYAFPLVPTYLSAEISGR